MRRHPILFLLTLALLIPALSAGAQDSGTAFLGIGVLPADDGVLVQDVMPGSPAEAAGLLVDDVLLSVDGEPVTADTVAGVIGGRAVGETVALEVRRGDETLQLEATLAARPDEQTTRSRLMPRMFGMAEGILLGVRVEQTDEGVIVREVQPDSPAAEAGVQTGDIITRVGDRDIKQVTDILGGLAAAAPGQPLTVEVSREGETVALEVTPGLPMAQFFHRRGFDMPFDMMPGGVRLGVTFLTLDEQIAQERGLDLAEGALITQVVKDSPADAAGIQVDDIITAVDGDRVDARRTLRDRLLAYDSGDVVVLSVVRGGETLELEATLDAMPSGDMFSGMFSMTPGMFRFFGPDGLEVLPPLFSPPAEKTPVPTL